MDENFIKKTNINFNLNELNDGLQFVLNNLKMKKIIDSTDQLSLCGNSFEDGLYNINTEKLSRHNIRKEIELINLNNEFKNTIWEKIWLKINSIENYTSCRMTIRKMKPKSSLLFHKDYSVRWHLAIKTNPFAYMTFLDRKSNTFFSYHIPNDGYIYFTNTKLWHTAVNSGNEDRYSLIISTYEN